MENNTFYRESRIIMIIAACKLTLRIEWSLSLKDKRMAVRKILDRTKAKYGISCAEVSDNDILNKAVLGFACVANEESHGREVIEAIIRYVESFSDAEICEINVDIFGL